MVYNNENKWKEQTMKTGKDLKIAKLENYKRNFSLIREKRGFMLG